MYKTLQDTKNAVNQISITYGKTYARVSEMHTHDFDEIVVILQGSAIQQINDEQYLTSMGDVFLVNSNDCHYFKNTENLYIFNIGFKKEVIENYKDLLLPLPGYHSFFVIEPKFRKQNNFKNKLHLNSKDLNQLKTILEKLKEEFTSQPSGKELMITSYFLQVVGFLCRKYEQYSTNTKTGFTSPLSDAISYIEKNYTNQITLDMLSQISGTPVSTLIAFFKRTFNQTPTEYIISLRINSACELLRHSNKSITYISDVSGFNDTNYFSRIFRKKIGLTPRDYRKKYSGII